MPTNTLVPETQTIKYGVMLEVLGMGVMLCGASRCGKSELALSLVDRGHRLIADDSVLLTREPNSHHVMGSCPEILADFLEVRGLGIINIRAMHGDHAILDRKPLQLIVKLVMMIDQELESIDRLHGMHTTQIILDCPIPEVTIPIAPGRNLAILVEAAVRNQILKSKGYEASLEFTKRHQSFIDATNQETL